MVGRSVDFNHVSFNSMVLRSDGLSMSDTVNTCSFFLVVKHFSFLCLPGINVMFNNIMIVITNGFRIEEITVMLNSINK